MHAIGVKNMMPAWTYDAAHSMADIFGEFQLGRVSDVDYGAVQHRRIHFKMPSWQTPFEDLQDIYRRSGYSEVTRTELIKGMGLGFIGYRAGPTFRGSIFRSYGGQVRAGPTLPFSSVPCLSSTTKTIRLAESTI